MRLLGLDQLRGGVSLVAELAIAREIGLGIRELGLVAVAIGGQLFDLGLIGPRIDLCEQIAGLDGLSFGEGDLDELSLDLAAHDVGVVGDHRADAAQSRSERPCR